MRSRSRVTINPMKKQLDTNAIINELRGNSAFFPSYKEEPAVEPVVEKTPPPPASTPHPVPPVRVVGGLPYWRADKAAGIFQEWFATKDALA